MEIKKNIPNNTITRKLVDLDRPTGNIYESINIIARRANQIATEIKTELNRKLADFSAPSDSSVEETFENREQIEISRYYERVCPSRRSSLPRSSSTTRYTSSTARPRATSSNPLDSRRHTLLWGCCDGCDEISHKVMLKGKHIILGITGSIAAYKAAMLLPSFEVRRMRGARGHDTHGQTVHHAAYHGHAVAQPYSGRLFDPENGAWNSHVSLGEWADCYLIAPATANTLAKMATGVADNLLLTTYLSARCPVAIAPAMDLDMYAHTTTQHNLAALRSTGVAVIEPGEGELASGLTGKGRMAEPEQIVAEVERLLGEKKESFG